MGPNGKVIGRVLMRTIAPAIIVIGMSAAMAALAMAGNTAQLSLSCSGNSYVVTISGNGSWVPARDNNSSLVFHPTAFGEVTRTFYPADGSPAQTQTAPANEFQAQQQNGHPRVACTFRFEHSDSGGTYIDTGSVSGWTS